MGSGSLGLLIGPFFPRLSLQRFKSEDAPKIHMALSISLFLLNLTFLINMGSGSQGPPASCRVRAAIFHYFLLCVFTWMSLEAFHLYLLAIRVFNTYFGHYFLKLSLLGWGRHRLEGEKGNWKTDREEPRAAQSLSDGWLEGLEASTEGTLAMSASSPCPQACLFLWSLVLGVAIVTAFTPSVTRRIAPRWSCE